MGDPMVGQSADVADRGRGNERGEAVDGAAIVVGTYDGGLLGLAADGAQLFGYAPHAGCVRALHARGGLAASGGTDHAVRLFDVGRGLELGELQEHDDSVTCLEFWGSTLVTGDGEGQVCIWQCGTWDLLLKFRAHKAGVVSLAIHPSGRLMATAGKDNGVRLWDLMRGTSAAHLAVDNVVEALEWSPDGGLIAALSPKELVMVNMLTSGAASFRDPESAGLTRVSLTAAMFIGEGILLVGDGKGDVNVLEPEDQGQRLSSVQKLPADSSRGRVKAISRCRSGPWDGRFALGTSAGRVEVWRFDARLGPRRPAAFERLAAVETGVRLTCLVVADTGPGPGAGPGPASRAAEGRGRRRRRGR